jgi:hypothetical protein
MKMWNKVDYNFICEKCIHREYSGTIMVGTDESGGPEESFRCKFGIKGRSDGDSCAHFDHEDDPFYY